MDAVTHALVGMAIAGITGHQPAVSDPIYIATVLGTQAPDFDIIAIARGNMAYLRQHRAFSHSIPGVALWSVAIAAGLAFFMPQASFGQLFAWALAGGLSHVILDYFNTHGAAICWPFRKERKSLPLLNVFDPLLVLLMLALYATSMPMHSLSLATMALLTLYTGFRAVLRHKIKRRLVTRFAAQGLRRIWVMPSLTRLWFWDFVVETENRYLNGRISTLRPVPEIQADLPKQAASALTQEASKTTIGEFFTTFTPFIYFEEQSAEDAVKVMMYDLRYYTGGGFIHSATVVFDQQTERPVAARWGQ